MDYRSLSSEQLDALREVFNIGTGNAATSLSWLLNKKVDMGVPNIRIVKLQDVLESELEHEVIAVLVKVIGEAPGNILYCFGKEFAMEITKTLTNNQEVFSDIAMSTMAEIGNIISSAYMSSIGTFTGLNMIPSVPAVTYDMFNAIFSSTFIDSGQVDEYLLDIETLFKGDSGSDVMGNFYYIPEPGSLENILKKLGMS